MLTLASGTTASATTEAKRSRFIAVVAPVKDESEARAVINEQKALYPDARHHCSAYVLKSEGATPHAHSSDDGEPSGTAGAPILEVLLGSNLVNVVAVVTRYFGGTLLGTGGLVRAYAGATQAALDKAKLARITQMPRYLASIDLTDAGRVEAELHRRGWRILDLTWGVDLTVDFAVPESEADQVEGLLAALTKSTPDVERFGSLTQEVRI